MEWILFAVLAAVLLALAFVYNRLVSLRQSVRQAWGDIDAHLKQRADLVPNLVSTVKGYAAHERDTLDALTAARSATARAAGPGQAAEADSLMGAALGRLFAVAEAYPDLKASANFSHLQDQLSELETKIVAARRFLNLSVAEYNAGREQFPAVLVASKLGFAEEAMFSLPEDQKEAAQRPPEVAF